MSGMAVSDADCGTRYLCKYNSDGLPTEKELLVKLSGARID